MKHSDVKIVPASLQHIAEISTIMSESWKSAYKEIVDETYLLDLKKDHWNDFLKDAINSEVLRCSVLIKENQIIGASVFGESITKEYPKDGELITLYLAPQYFGLGYGRLLFEHAEQELKNMGYKNLLICVFSENIRAINLYESYEFEVISTKNETKIGKQEIPFTIMRKAEKSSAINRNS